MESAELVREIIELERRVSRVLQQHVPDAWMELSLTIAQLKSLFFIANEGGANFKKLAAALEVTPSNVTGIVDRLVEQGLVTRQASPTDRRMHLLRATDKGEALLDDLRERTTSQMAKVLARMPKKELSALARGLASLAKAAEAYNEESGKYPLPMGDTGQGEIYGKGAH